MGRCYGVFKERIILFIKYVYIIIKEVVFFSFFYKFRILDIWYSYYRKGKLKVVFIYGFGYEDFKYNVYKLYFNRMKNVVDVLGM